MRLGFIIINLKFYCMKRILLVCIVLLVGTVSLSFAQSRTISGAVTAQSDGAVIPGVNVVLKGTATGTVTDVDGNYQISVPQEGGILTFSFIGMTPEEVEIGNSSVINVALVEDIKQLTEVVVTALGVEREQRSLGYSVQEVQGESLAKSRETNIVNALQGEVAGVQIQGTQGALGGSSRITIRGSNSFLGNNQPLFVVDGVPMDNSSYSSNSQQSGFGLGNGQYDYGNPIADINPEDIENISVLKGAAATALYGVRGSNGVIVVTTKTGKGKKGIGVTVNSSLTLDEATNLIPHQELYGGGAIQPTASGFTEFTQDGVSYLAPAYSKDGAWGPKYDANIMVRHWDSWDPLADNYKETRPWVAPENDYSAFFETGKTWTNSVAFDGSNENGSFRLGYTNLDQSGITPESNMKRNTISFSGSYNLTNKLTASASVNFVNTKANGRNITGYNNGNPMQAFTQWWQTQLDVERLKNYEMTDGSQYTWNSGGLTLDDDGELISYDPSPVYFDNPYFVRNEFLQEDDRNRLFGNIELSYEINEHFTITGKAMRDGFSFMAREGWPQQTVDNSEYSETTRSFNETNFDGRINYTQNFGDISVSAIVGGNRMHQTKTYSKVSTVGGIALDKFWHLSNSVGGLQYDVNSVRPNQEEWAINSVYALASFGWRNIFFIDGSVRSDWASTLPEAENPFVYPSVSTSFIWSEYLNTDFISFGKLRAGYGQAANSPTPYSLETTYAPVSPNFGSASRFSVPDSRNNPNLRPEFTTEWEVGVAVNFWNDRLGFDVSYYNRETTDQIVPVDVSKSTGYDAQWINSGTMKNSGFEVMINAIPVQVGDFAWNLNLNFATYNNDVVELAEGVDQILVGSTWAANTVIQEGQPYMAIFGEDFVRNEDGRVIVDDDGFPTSTGEYAYLGSAIADYTGGLRNTFMYKGLSLSALIDFQKGGAIHSTSLQWANYSGMTPESAMQNGIDVRENGMILDAVTESGAENTTPIDPQTYYQSYWTVASPNVYDASFIKLREIGLTYTLPSNLLSNTPFREISLGVFGRNLAILSSDLPYLDPQVIAGAGNNQGLENAQVPSTRSLGFNLGLKF